MIKRLFLSLLFVFIAVALTPAPCSMAAPLHEAIRQSEPDDDICRYFGNAQEICRYFLKIIESNRSLGQLQIVHIQTPVAFADPELSSSYQVHVFVVKDEKQITNQAVGRDYELYVIVLDRNNQPIPGAKVDYLVEYVDHREKSTMPQTTNAEGIASAKFRVNMFPTYQMVNVGVLVNTNGKQQSAGTAFWGGY